MEEDFETGEILVEGPSVKKIYTSQESFSRSRISNIDVAKYFLCRVCGKYPKRAKVSVSCGTFTARFALTNYKAGVNTTKCPPAHAAIKEETGLVEDSCIIPSKIDDIINIAGFLREATATISVVLSWCQNHKISSCDFLFFALNRLITREAPQLEFVQQVF